MPSETFVIAQMPVAHQQQGARRCQMTGHLAEQSQRNMIPYHTTFVKRRVEQLVISGFSEGMEDKPSIFRLFILENDSNVLNSDCSETT